MLQTAKELRGRDSQQEFHKKEEEKTEISLLHYTKCFIETKEKKKRKENENESADNKRQIRTIQ